MNILQTCKNKSSVDTKWWSFIAYDMLTYMAKNAYKQYLGRSEDGGGGYEGFQSSLTKESKDVIMKAAQNMYSCSMTRKSSANIMAY